MIKVKKNYPLVLILFLYTVLVFPTMSKPFYGHHDWNGAWYSNMARNILRYSITETKLGSVMNSGSAEPKNFQYFTHYPPLLPIFLSAAFFLFGQSESIARLVPLIFTLFAITMVYKLGTKFMSKNAGLLGALIYSVFPITLYFGKMPVQEVLVIGPVLLSIYLYFNFFEKSTRTNFLKLLASLIFSHLINWPGYYVTPLFFLHYLTFSKKHNIKIALIFPTLSVSMFALHTLYTFVLTRDLLGGGLIDALLYRLNVTNQLIGFSPFNFLNQQAHLLVIYYTLSALTLCAVGLIFILLDLKNRHISKTIQLLVILGVFGITHNAVFQNMAFIHDYMIIYLTPFIALLTSYAFFHLVTYFKLLKTLALPLALVLVLAISTERYQFTKTIINSRSFYEGYDLGNLIKANTSPQDKIIVLSPGFQSNFDVFVGYYSDRNVTYDPLSSQQIQNFASQNKYQLYVAIPARDTSVASIIELQKHFNETIIGDYFLYKPK